MEYIRTHLPEKGDDVAKIRNATMALHALNHLIVNTPGRYIFEIHRAFTAEMKKVYKSLTEIFLLVCVGLEIMCIGYFKLLFSLLSVTEFEAIQKSALHVIATATRNQECVNDIAAIGVVVYLLLTLYTLPSEQVTILSTLSALSTSTTIVKDILSKGTTFNFPNNFN